MIITPDEGLNICKDLLRKKKLSVFAGSGISVDSGLPSWDGFVDKYIEICDNLNKSLPNELKFEKIIDEAKNHSNSNLIETITALKDKVTVCQESGINTDFFIDSLFKIFYNASSNEYHKLLVSTSFGHIITTNYDTLLEDAAKNLNYNDLLIRSYSYNDYQKITASIYSEQTAIIHAHGKIVDLRLDQFVLTQQDYLNIMKHNPGFRLIMNTIFITNSVLFVGYGGSDPHFEDIIKDLNFSLNWEHNSKVLPKCYIMMKKDKATPIREFLSDSNRVDIISFENFDKMKAFLRDLKSAFPRPHSS